MPRGSCLCGAVRYDVGEIRSLSNCHCSRCRRQHGAAYATYAEVASDDLGVSDELGALQSFQSSAAVRREFCGRCGSKMFYRNEQHPHTLWIDAGTFDDDPGLTISAHHFAASKANWYDIDDDLPQHPAWER